MLVSAFVNYECNWCHFDFVADVCVCLSTVSTSCCVSSTLLLMYVCLSTVSTSCCVSVCWHVFVCQQFLHHYSCQFDIVADVWVSVDSFYIVLCASSTLLLTCVCLSTVSTSLFMSVWLCCWRMGVCWQFLHRAVCQFDFVADMCVYWQFLHCTACQFDFVADMCMSVDSFYIVMCASLTLLLTCVCLLTISTSLCLSVWLCCWHVCVCRQFLHCDVC